MADAEYPAGRIQKDKLHQVDTGDENNCIKEGCPEINGKLEVILIGEKRAISGGADDEKDIDQQRRERRLQQLLP